MNYESIENAMNEYDERVEQFVHDFMDDNPDAAHEDVVEATGAQFGVTAQEAGEYVKAFVGSLPDYGELKEAVNAFFEEESVNPSADDEISKRQRKYGGHLRGRVWSEFVQQTTPNTMIESQDEAVDADVGQGVGRLY